MLDNTVFFSVIIPVFNKENTIRATIQSVLNQTYTNFELLVVNDGSTDESQDEVNSIIDGRLKCIDKKNGGVSSARNLGIIEAKGQYIAFLDGDDEWEQDFLETIVSLIKKYPDISVFSTGFAFLTNSVVTAAQKIDDGIVENYFKKALDTPVVHSSSICIKKDVFEIISPFNEKITHGEDLELWSRIGKIYKIAVCKEVKSYYRRGLENQATNIMSNPKQSIVNYIEFDSSQDIFEKRYFQKIIVSRVFSYVKRKQFIYASKVFLKYFKYLKIGQYVTYYIIKKEQLKRDKQKTYIL
jgi:glycosyltransferase involved in cell wall biosynthesis